MSDAPTHALFVYGEWIHATYDDGQLVWGLDPNIPVRVVQASRENGHIAETILALREKNALITCTIKNRVQPRSVGRNNHSWAQWLSDEPRSADAIAFCLANINAPDTIPRPLMMPMVDGKLFEYLNPPIREDAGYSEEFLLPPSANGISAPPKVHDEITAKFRALLRQVFSRLAQHKIFGCEINGNGWASSEGWDLAASQVPVELSRGWKWDTEAAMSLCWCDIGGQILAGQEELATFLYGANGMNEEWWDRVAIWDLPEEPVTSTTLYYGGPDVDAKLRIGRVVSDAAQSAGLEQIWNGDPDQAISIALQSS